MNKDDTFWVEARGAQQASGAAIDMIDGRARIFIEDGNKITLTQIQTAELANWILERANYNLQTL